ncbi:MAG: L,D-transpeptidase family protein [Xanthobacteraceae bacterium]
MGMSRLERLLAGVAVIAIIAATTPALNAATDTPDAVQAGVPIPEPANISPPTAADVDVPAKAEPSAAAAPAATPEPAKAVAEPAKPVEPVKAAEAPAPTPNDILAGKIKDLLAAKTDRYFSSKKDRAGAEAFYTARNNAPVWVAAQAATDNAKALATYLSAADAEGLDPADYPVPRLTAGMDADALADAELKLTAAALTFARHSQVGRVHYSRVSPDIFYNLEAADPNDVLAKLAEAKNPADALASYTPQHPQYKALKAKLAEARSDKNGGPVRVPAGATLKFDAKKPMTDSRVPLLRDRLGVTGDASDETYDKPLADAVAAFQKKNGIKVTGQFNTATLDRLNGPKRDRDADIILANMERWRWMPHDLGKNRVILNIPDYTLHVYSGDAQVWQTRVVVGKPGQHATPLLTETMKYITVNPTWNVPPSIVYNEYLPALQQDPTVLSRMGLKLVQDRGGGIHISQPPGEANALGRIRFNFPNKFLVYQHDTPDKNLFKLDKRAFSHGCMRVQDPAKYAEVILGLANPSEHYTQERIKSMYGNSEIDIKLANQIPVHITYQTAFVDDAGNLQIRDDVYGRDSRLVAILKGDERKIAEMPVEHAQQSYAHPSVTLPPGVAGANGPTYSNGPGFFEMLFGGGNRQPPQPPARVPRNRQAAR